MHDPRTRTALYTKTLVRSRFAYSSQVWSPQSVSLILEVEKIQRRATRFILSLPFRSETSYHAGETIENRFTSSVLLARVPGLGVSL